MLSEINKGYLHCMKMLAVLVYHNLKKNTRASSLIERLAVREGMTALLNVFRDIHLYVKLSAFQCGKSLQSACLHLIAVHA